jgi:hypothetical protein
MSTANIVITVPKRTYRRSVACFGKLVRAAGVLSVAMTLQACSDADESASSGEAAIAAIDPCLLVTPAEAAQALGAPAEADRPREANIPPRLATCRYAADRDPALAVMTVMVRQGYSDSEAKTSFDLAREQFAQAEGVDGLGEQAFRLGDQLHVLSGTTHFTIAGDIDDAVARSLAEQALERL